MENRILRNALAILLCVLTLLLAACGSEKSEENATVNEDVQLSNIRFSDMNLTEEENKMMQDVQGLLHGFLHFWMLTARFSARRCVLRRSRRRRARG